ncbi:hypothetical protein WICPIJ_006939 [Wickerhamomyces pijperi]|uniref:COP9 signalosome complex subunit 5 n=1 Tax=Wickerhamomyces pijperi TaxID=599730 RepID=A0A9P8Q2L1_WICPI|nr:hypothetical protein WICPIJ_006939 [Wickerhamomyces pijperi]
MSSSDNIVDSIKASKEALFLNTFSHHKCSTHDHSSSKDNKSEATEKNKPDSGPNPKEMDIDQLLNVPLSTRASKFYDEETMNVQSALLNSTTPWKANPNYFQTAHISSLALLKMSIHARSGGSIEVMGMLTGKIVKQGIVVMDVYPLPVEGTETRVNALSEGYEFMVDYLDSLKKTGRNENIVGWYHSHPGYGCWLSGIDVGTQSLNQRFQDPYLAIVVDPERTIANGKVEIGAFRTYPEDYVDKLNSKSSSSSSSDGKSGSSLAPQSIIQNSKDIPAEKIKDFGLHTSHYYSLNVEIFRSELEECVLKNLWNKYWVSQFIENEQKKEITDEKITLLIQRKLADLNRGIDALKRSPLTKSLKKPQQAEQASEKSTSLLQTLTNNNPLSMLTNSQLSPFTRNNFFGGGAAHVVRSRSPANREQRRSNSKQADESDLEESDSEMNDADDADEDRDVELNDSDSQMGEDDDDDDDFVARDLRFSQAQAPTAFQGFTNKIRSTFYNNNGKNGSGSPIRRTLSHKKSTRGRDIVSGGRDSDENSSAQLGSSMDQRTADSRINEKALAVAGISSRELINLKIQEILFLNE